MPLFSFSSPPPLLLLTFFICCQAPSAAFSPFRNPSWNLMPAATLPMDPAFESSRTFESDLIVGIAMIIIPILCSTAYVFILTAIFRDKELFKMTSYKFMFVLGCFDVTQCLPHLITGVFTICQSTGEYWLAKILGVMATPFYVGYCMMTIILSIQRFTQILSPSWEQRLFSPVAVWGWIGVAILIVVSFIIALATPWASITYVPKWYSWSYDYSLPFSGIVQKVEMTLEISSILISLILYIGVVILLVKTRARFSSSRKYSTEGKILIQALAVTVYCSILNTLWHNYDKFLPLNLWTYCALNFMWIMNSGVYPTVYLMVNSTIRTKITSKKSKVDLTNKFTNCTATRTTQMSPRPREPSVDVI